MRIIGAIAVAVLVVFLAGCGSPDRDRQASGGGAAGVAGRGTSDETSRAADGRSPSAGRVFLTVDFQPGQTLRYQFTSKKKITVDWDPNAAANSNHVQEQAESFEMVVAYTPVEVDPYGTSTIRAVVESVRAVRSGGPASRNFGPDAVQAAQGKSFTIKVDPRGKIVDAAELSALIQEMGKRAFRAETSGGRVKEPDMIWDFVASQWFLWDAESAVERPAEGVALGQTWRSQLCVPTPMVMRLARNVVYKLAEVRQNAAGSPWRGRGDPKRDPSRLGTLPALASRGHLGLVSSDHDASVAPEVQGQDALATRRQGRDALATPEGATGPLAVIQSTYTPADSAPAGWPIPYSGKLQVSGTFGFLSSYEVLGLEGTGEELFNTQAGRIEQRRETYTLRTKAGLPPMGIKANPYITIEQTLTMELMEPGIRNSNIEPQNKSE